MIEITEVLNIRNRAVDVCADVDWPELTVEVDFEGAVTHYGDVFNACNGRAFPEPLKSAYIQLIKEDDTFQDSIERARQEWRNGQRINQMCDAKGGEA